MPMLYAKLGLDNKIKNKKKKLFTFPKQEHRLL